MSCKVRFAPSPTGFLHAGNARIAIVNYLFSLQNGGNFLLRIDDTDTSRSKKEYEDSILRELSWLGIKHNEFCRQSERIHRYNEVMRSLVQRGVVYRCYETNEELVEMRSEAFLRGRAPVYDRASLKMSADEILKLGKTGSHNYWRFKLPDGYVSWNDIVLGDISYDLNSISDPVVMKADGSFLYTFTSVVDDIDYNITHVIRGQDHVTNTSAQIAMFKEIAGRHPEFAHLSLFVNIDGSHFSKRLGSMNLTDMRECGLDRMSIINFLATFGSSLDPVPFLNMDDLVNYFDIKKFSKSSARFDIDSVLVLNKKILKQRTYDEIKDVLGDDFTISPEAFEVVRDNVMSYDDVREWNKILSPGFKCRLKFSENEVRTLNAAIELVRDVEPYYLLQAIREKIGADKEGLYMPMRKAVTGREHGPDLKALLKAIGKSEIERRVKRCLERYDDR
jgi:glutamyl-tRNA synthetase